jgi:hypothetical protein
MGCAFAAAAAEWQALTVTVQTQARILREKTTFPFYSPCFETPLSHDRGERHVILASLGG